MKLKYLSILLSWLVILPVGAFASADDPYTSYNNDLSSYDPSSFSLSDTFENNSLDVLDFSCSSSDLCLLSIQDDDGFNCDIMAMGDSITYNNCSTQTLSSDWSNMLYFSMWWEGYAWFDYINLHLVEWSSGGAWGGDIPWDDSTSDWLSNFSSSLNTLVGNLTISFSDYLPTLILIWFGVVILFVFRWYIKHATVELFSMYKNRKKSEWRYQNEDVNAMYKDRKNDFVKNHDLNNAVSERYYNASSRQDIFEKDYFNNRDKYYYDELVHNWDHFFRSNKETWEEEELFTDWKWYKTWGNFKTWVVWKRFNVD